MSNNNPKSMGDLFMQRRAAAAAGRNSSTGNAAKKKSFAEIQREQLQEEQRMKQQSRQREKQQQEEGYGGRQQQGWSQGQRERQQHQVDEYGRLVRPSGSISASGGGNARGSVDGIPRGAGGSNRRGNTSANIRSSLPSEQGVVHTLLDKFGFILCADRDWELFFHYSECRGMHSDQLNIGDEVEFRVGRAEERGGRRSQASEDGEKWCAFDLKILPKGTIYWEKEDEPLGRRRTGVVDRTAREEQLRRGRGPGSGGMAIATMEGLIRMFDEDCGCEDCNEDEDADAKTKIEVYYTPSNYSARGRLDRKDLVEFTLVTERRTKKKYARNITLIRSEKEEQRLEREAKLLEDAILERGRVACSKGDYGFLKSANRMEEVYYHISNLLLTDEEDTKKGMRGNDARVASLKDGQDVEFYVVNEAAGGGGGGGGGKKGGKGLSARKIRLLPWGTVQFERTIVTGVTGIVVDCPVGNVTDPFCRRDKDRRGGIGGSKNTAATVGKILLEEAIIDDNEEVTHVSLHSDFYPGGTFAISRTGNEIGTFLRSGDVVLFDVVKRIADGLCCAMPTIATKKLNVRSSGGREGQTSNDYDNDATNSSVVKPSVRLIEPSLCGRTEGTVRSIHDNYGFISLAERGNNSGSVDAYFPLCEVFPSEIQADLARNNFPDIPVGNGDDDNFIRSKGGRVHLEVGMEVAFDLSLHILPNGPGVTGGRGGGVGRYGNRQVQEKENLRARRIQILPNGTVKEKISIALGVKATVTKEDTKQPFVGTLELQDFIKFDSYSARYPKVTGLLDGVSRGRYGEKGVTFHDVISDKDAQVVISMVNARSDLEWSYVDVPEIAAGNPCCNTSGKLHIVRKKKINNDGIGKEVGQKREESRPSSADAEAPPTAAAEVSISSAKVRANTSESVDGASYEKRGKVDEGTGQGGSVVGRSTEVGVAAVASNGVEKQDPQKKKGKKAKILRMLRFDKFSLHDINIGPLGVGDIVTCDILQTRRSGTIIVENIAVVERKQRSTGVSDGDEDGKENNRKSLSGFVTELIPSRQFGFITAVNEQGSKTGDHIFFHFKEIKSSANDAQDGGSSAGGRSKKSFARGDAAIVRRGEEVRFDVGPGKNGKLSAANITILPRGTLTLSEKVADKSSSCTGYILMEPSHTSLANTPSHIVLQSGSTTGAGRWDNVRDDKSAVNKLGSTAKEEGVILLLSDPSHLFSPRPKRDDGPLKTDVTPGKNTTSSTDTGSESEADIDDSAAGSKINGINVQKVATKAEAKDIVSAVVGTHVRYKLSSIMAVRGSSGPKRGDLVSFGKTRGAKFVKDIRIEKMGAAASAKGILVEIDRDNGTAVFIPSDNNNKSNNIKYEIKLTEVVSCDRTLLKDKEQVDGILHAGKIFGVCRTKDICLVSSIGRNSSGSSGGHKERPRLNLTVKKELQGMGGQIMAQSRMAKGPDGTNGFAPGWTRRISLHVATMAMTMATDEKEESPSKSLSAAASEFVPNFAMSNLPATYNL